MVSCSIAELKQMIAELDFPINTPVFDNTVQTLGQLRTNWEVPAKQSWIARYFSPVVSK